MLTSEAEVAERGVIIGTTAKRPEELTVALFDRCIVYTCDAPAHQTVIIEFPVFVTIASKPLTAVVMPLVGEAHSYTIFMESPKFLDEAIIQFPLPFAG